MKLFHPIETIDWTRVLLVIGSATAFWTALSRVIPLEYHRVGESFLTACTAAVTVLIRSNKWARREETLTEKQEEKR